MSNKKTGMKHPNNKIMKTYFMSPGKLSGTNNKNSMEANPNIEMTIITTLQNENGFS